MSAGLRFGNRQISPVVILSVLAAVLAIFALLLPETVDESPGNSSTHSPAPAGARMAFQLAERMGWRASRREKPLASVDGRTVQVVLSPQELLGADEVHRLLENVRMGGGLMFDVLNGKEIGDSLGLSAGPMRAMLSLTADTKCKSDESRVVRTMTEILPPSVFDVKWRRPPPSAVIPIDVSLRRGVAQPVALVFELGAGMVVAVASPEMFQNYAIRVCQWDADVGVARALESLRPPGVAHPAIVFDEFHHGFGPHGGSVTAVTSYLAHTASGHFLEQVLIAGLVLLMAYSPRAILPRDPLRVVRRSPLEHADALAHAYEDVEATRTATSRLMSGVRRRVGRTVVVAAAADDTTFLDAVVLRTPSLAPSVEVVRRALSETLTRRQFAAVAGAVMDIEQQLSTTLPKGS